MSAITGRERAVNTAQNHLTNGGPVGLALADSYMREAERGMVETPPDRTRLGGGGRRDRS